MRCAPLYFSWTLLLVFKKLKCSISSELIFTDVFIKWMEFIPITCHQDHNPLPTTFIIYGAFLHLFIWLVKSRTVCLSKSYQFLHQSKPFPDGSSSSKIKNSLLTEISFCYQVITQIGYVENLRLFHLERIIISGKNLWNLGL